MPENGLPGVQPCERHPSGEGLQCRRNSTPKAFRSEFYFSENTSDPDVDNLRIRSMQAVVYPQLLIDEFPLGLDGRQTVINCRKAIVESMNGLSDKLVVIVGPCSIHDHEAAIQYAGLLKPLVTQYEADLVIVMRVYFEKPRTTIGWKGLINDPCLDDSCNINLGLKIARQLLVHINQMGVPAGTEFLDCITPQFISDTVSWGAIGARTAESQLHRQLASGLSMPVGFKNSTTGQVQVAVDAIHAARIEHCFLSVLKLGTIAIVTTTGNQDCHAILRGGSSGPNYDRESVREAVAKLQEGELNPRLMIDFSHGNSQKQFLNQISVCDSICGQLASPDSGDCIFGVMIESNLEEGNQAHVPGIGLEKELRRGVSITDGCLGWEDTIKVVDRLAEAVRTRRHRHEQQHGLHT